MERSLLVLLLMVAPVLVWAAEDVSKSRYLAEGKRRFELHCGACHSLELPRAQHLDRQTWEWVLDDMVAEFGAERLTAEDRELILDYLVAEHGPRK